MNRSASVALLAVLFIISVSSGWSGYYRITNRFSDKVLDVTDRFTDNGVPIQQWEWTGGTQQQWEIIDLGDDQYKIVSRLSGKVLEVKGPDWSEGTAIQQWEWADHDQQKWTITEVTSGCYTIKNIFSGKVVGLEYGCKDNGCKIEQWNYAGDETQQWLISSFSPTANIFNPFQASVNWRTPYDGKQATVEIFSDKDLSTIPYTPNTQSPWADSLIIAYSAGLSFPQKIDDPGVRTERVALCEIIPSFNQSYRQSITVPALSGADSCYNFSYTVKWRNPDTLLPLIPAGSIYRIDSTETPENLLILRGSYISLTDYMTIAFTNISSLGSSDSAVVVRLSFGSLMNPSFCDTVFTSAQLMRSSSFVVTNSCFFGQTATVYVAWRIINRKGDTSPWGYTFCVVGNPLPIYEGALYADSVQGRPDMIALSWDAPTMSVDTIRIWWDTKPIPLTQSVPLGTQFIEPNINATKDTLEGLSGNTKYYVGLQVKKAGLWSVITALSTASVITSNYQPGDPIPNVIEILSSGFDTVKNAISLSMRLLRTEIPAGMQVRWGYSIGVDLESVNGKLPVTWHDFEGEQMQTEISLGQEIIFDTVYYVGIWEQPIVNGVPLQPNGPGDSVVTTIRIPKFTWQKVVFFPEGVDTVLVNNGNIILKEDNAMQIGTWEDTLRIYTPDIKKLDGFIRISDGFRFKVGKTLAPFSIGIRYGRLPSGVDEKDISVYRDSCGMLKIAYDSKIENGMIWFLASDLSVPFVVLADTIRPKISLDLGTTDTSMIIAAGSAVPYVFDIADNVTNAWWRMEFGRGDEGYVHFFTDTLTSRHEQIVKVILNDFVSEASGMRCRIIFGDGVFTDTIDVSRKVRDSRGERMYIEAGKWLPVSTPKELDRSSPLSILANLMPNKSELYDKSVVRLFKWDQGSNTEGKWFEYDPASSELFDFAPGRLMWIKSAKSGTITYGAGMTLSLKEPFEISLPSHAWTDFSIPFSFDIMLYDLIAANPDASENVNLYHWCRANDGSFFNNEVYLPNYPDNATTLDTAILPSGVFNNGYTAFNAANHDVKLLIPPSPLPLSKAPTKKQLKQKDDSTWCLCLQWRRSNELQYFHNIRIGFDNTGLNDPTWYPLPPSFEPSGAGVYCNVNRKIYAHTLLHSQCNGGVEWEIAFFNNDIKLIPFEFRLSDHTSIPKGFAVHIYDETGEDANDTSWHTVNVNPNRVTKRTIVVGTAAYLNDFKTNSLNRKMALLTPYPNPAKAHVIIRFSVPHEYSNSIYFSLTNLQGRTIWSRRLTGELKTGENDLFWGGRDTHGKPVSAGVYILRMSTLDVGTNAQVIGEHRITLLR